MGTTTMTLHVRGIDKDTLVSAAGRKTVLWDNNPPWIDLLAPDPEGALALERLAKKLTKASPEAAALLFLYFDDDMFSCDLYRGGKKAAGCLSQESWARLGKALDSLFGDDLAGKAFRYASRCTDLEEQLCLLEESVGTALLDHPEFEPRTVPRGDACLREIKGREAALRKRKNQCVLTELPVGAWPTDWQAQLALYTRIRPNWSGFDAFRLLYDFGDFKGNVPQHPELAFHTFWDAAGRKRLLLFDLDSKTMTNVKFPKGIPGRLLWQTAQREPVLLLSEILRQRSEFGGWFQRAGTEMVVCLAPDGSPRWRFVPSTEGERLAHVHSSPQGVLTLFVRSHQHNNIHFGAQLWQIDGETGALLRKRAFSVEERAMTLVRAEALGAFVYVANSKEIVVLNDQLEEISRWPGWMKIGLSDSIKDKNVVGSVLWGHDFSSRSLRRYDLRTGEETETRPEVPIYVFAVLPDGRFLGVNDRGNCVTVFDPAGAVISRHKLEGPVRQVRWDGERVLLLENRTPGHSFVSEALFASASIHVWRLDPA